MLAAPLAIAMLDAAGVNVDPVNILALTQVNITVIDHGRDVDDVFVAGRVATEARSQIFTEASFYDAGDREKLIGLGSANWSVICPTPDGFVYPEPGEGVDEHPTFRHCGRPTRGAGVPTVCSRFQGCGRRSAPSGFITGRCSWSPRRPRSMRVPRRSVPTHCASIS